MKPYRVQFRLTYEQHAKLKRLGGSEWLQQAVDAAPEPEAVAHEGPVRDSRDVPEHERAAILQACGQAKVIARRFNVHPRFVYYLRDALRESLRSASR